MKKNLFISILLFFICSISLNAQTLNLNKGWNSFGATENKIYMNQFKANNKIVGVMKYKGNSDFSLTPNNWDVWASDQNLMSKLSDAGFDKLSKIYKGEAFFVYSLANTTLNVSGMCFGNFLPIVTESYNYQTGGYDIIDLTNLTAYKNLNSYTLGGDIRTYTYGDYIFVVDAPNTGNTSTWYVYKINETASSLNEDDAKTIIANYNIKRQNPQSIAFLSESKAYLSTYFDNNILIFNPLTGAELGTIDLTPYLYTSDNGTTNKYIGAEHMVTYKNKLYVTVDRARTYYGDIKPEKSMVLVIDTSTNKVEKAIEVPFEPRAPQIYDNYLYFLAMGEYSNPIGKIYRINLSNNSIDKDFLVSPIKNDNSTEYIKNFVINPEGQLYFVTNSGWGQPYNVYLIENVEQYNDTSKTGLNTTPVYTTPGYIPDIDFVCGYIVVADRGKADIDYTTKEVKSVLTQGALVFIDTNGKVVKKILDTDLGYPPYKIGSDYNY